MGDEVFINCRYNEKGEFEVIDPTQEWFHGGETMYSGSLGMTHMVGVMAERKFFDENDEIEK